MQWALDYTLARFTNGNQGLSGIIDLLKSMHLFMIYISLSLDVAL